MMKTQQLAVVALIVVIGGSFAQEDSPEEIAKTIDRAQQANERDVAVWLQKSLGAADKARLTPLERKDLAGRFIKVVQERRVSMDHLEQVLKEKGKKHVARQIVYRRVVEQWHVTQPLPFRVLWDCPKGQEPTLRSIVAGQ